MKSKCWLTMVCWALVCLVLGLIQQATRRRFRAQANGWIDAENPRLVRPLHRLSKARNSIRLVLDRSHLWSSRIRGVREILAHPGKKPMGHRRRSEIGGCQSKTAAQNNNEPPCPRKFLTQPTEFEKSGILQHPLATRISTISPHTWSEIDSRQAGHSSS